MAVFMTTVDFEYFRGWLFSILNIYVRVSSVGMTGSIQATTMAPALQALPRHKPL